MNRPLAVAWAAGFLDGEGSLSLRVSNRRPGQRRYRPLVEATQLDRAPLELFCELFGGSIRSTGNAWRWTLANTGTIRAALTEMRPFLTVKAAEADVLLEFVGTLRVGAGPGRGHVLSQVELARRASLAASLHDIRRERREAFFGEDRREVV